MDEMNTHIPQSLQTRVEIEEIASVPTQIISPAKSTPIISVVQDSMIGSYLMTRDKLAMTGEQLFHYLMPIIQLKSNFNFMEARKKRFWTGKELFSIILPNVSLENSKVTIKNGDIVDGFMDKKTLGGGPNGIIQAVFNQFGPRVCRDFLDNLQRLVITWMEDTGFTIGFGDAIPAIETRNNIQEVLQNKMLKSDELIRKAQLGMFKPELSDALRVAALEIELLNITSEATSEVEEIVQDNLPDDNHFIESVRSGSKGNPTNLNQIMGTIGQQSVDGRRVNFGWNGRTLPHFTKWDNSLASRGFCYSSYMNGMRPHEFFYASMASRVSKINSNIRTAETGYIQRRLVKALEDIRVCYDDTVRDAANNIVQYVYGMDGFDPVKLEHIPIRLLSIDNKEMEDTYQWSIDDLSESVFTEEAFERIKSNRKSEGKLMEEEQKQLQEDRYNLRYELFRKLRELKDKTVLSPVNFKRMLQEIVDQFRIDRSDVSDMTPGEVIMEVRKLVDYTVKHTPNKNSFPIMKILIRSHLSSKQCINELRLPKSVFLHVVETVKHKILYAYVNPGEMIGVVAAQSIGEPVTQLNLNSIDYTDKITVNGERCFSGQIGDFIEKEIELATKPLYLENETTYVDISQKDLEVVCVDEKGKTHWKKIEAVTKHLPGKDGILLKVRTKAGRVVHATKAKSFLARRNNLVVGITGEELKIGDYLPVTIQLPKCKQVRDHIELSQYLPKTEFLCISNVELDENFGFMIGTHLTEKRMNNRYQDYVRQFLDRYFVGRDEDFITQILNNMCGNGSANKYVPPFVFTANKLFVRGILDGYFSGNGTVNLQQKAILATSTSEKLVDGVLDLLSVFGIFGRKYGPTMVKKNNVGTRIKDSYTNKESTKNLRSTWTIGIRNMFAHRFAQSVTLTEPHKQARLEKIRDHTYTRNSFCNALTRRVGASGYELFSEPDDIIPSVITSHLNGDYRRDELARMLREDLSDNDRDILEEAVNSEVYFDKIVSIEEVKSTTKYVYDLTVADTRNFCLLGGLHVRDTFHFSGVGSKTMITNAGVPRIQEIINMSKDIKTPSMTIYLKPEYSTNREAAMEVKNNLEYTEIQDILASSEILYMPNVKEGKFDEEKKIYESYEEMLELMDMECQDPDSLSNWVLWMEFDREAMLQKGIYMQDIHEEIIKNCSVDTEIQCVVSDMNSGNLTLRIRVRQDFDEGEDYITFFRSLGDCLLTLPLRGVPGIKKVIPVQDCTVRYKADGSPEIVKEWILSTDGSNLIEVLSNDYVDPIQTTTNDIYEIYELFGIEGVRYAIIREMETTIAAGGASVVDYRHFAVLADLMTYRGKVMQIQRHGFGKSPYIGPLGRATYEVMDKVLITAGIFAETDNMEGTSANIIAGQAVRTGTNAFDLILNQDLLPAPKEQVSLLPPEPKVSDLPEMGYSPAMAPLEDTEAFEFGTDFDDVTKKMNASKEVNLDDYLRDIGNQPSLVDDSEFTFGFDIDNQTQTSLPPSNFDHPIQLNIVKSSTTNTNRRRRKK